MHAKIVQRPVGQGGLCEGRLFLRTQAGKASSSLVWLYDCGSNQEPALHREIAKAHGEIDVLFVSHVHADHVSGIEHLLKNKTVRQIVLPYLEPDTRLMLLAQAAMRDELTASYQAFLANPLSWVRSRSDGATVTYVDGDDGEGDIAEVPDPPSPDGRRAAAEEPLELAWIHSGANKSDNGVEVVGQGAVLAVRSGAMHLNWVFATHVHKPSQAKREAFRKALHKTFPGMSDAKIKTAAHTKAGLKKLRTCYDALWRDHNLVSLSLYAGPTQVQPDMDGLILAEEAFEPSCWPLHDFDCPPPWEGDRTWGWISTGDADLSGPRRRAAFLKTYQSYLPQVAVLLAPHHGSRHNWSEDLLKAMPNLRVGIAPAGPNDYGHPHQAVRDSFGKHGVPFFAVGLDRRLSQLVFVP